MLISNKIEYLEKEELQKFFHRSYIIILTDLSNAIKNLRVKILFHKHFNHNVTYPRQELV